MIAARPVWIVGNSIVYWGFKTLRHVWRQEPRAPEFLDLDSAGIRFHGYRGLTLARLSEKLKKKLEKTIACGDLIPRVIVIHCGINDLAAAKEIDKFVQWEKAVLQDVFNVVAKLAPKARIVWSDVLPLVKYKMDDMLGLLAIDRVNATAHQFCYEKGGGFIHHSSIIPRRELLYRYHRYLTDPVHLSEYGYRLWIQEIARYLFMYFMQRIQCKAL